MADVAVHPLVGNDGTCLDGRRKHHSIEVFASAEGYINLSWSEGEIGIDDGPLEGETLTFVDGDGPGQSQGQLVELSLNLRLNLAGFRVQLVLGILPGQRFHLYRLGIARTEHADHTVADFHDFTDSTVVIAVLTRRVVLDKHHLCAFFQHQQVARRIGIFREVAFDFGFEGVTLGGQLGQFTLVIVVCQTVVSGQSDIAFTRFWDEGGMVALVEDVDVLGRWFGFSDMVEYVEKGVVFLTIDLFQLYGDIFYLL